MADGRGTDGGRRVMTKMMLMTLLAVTMLCVPLTSEAKRTEPIYKFDVDPLRGPTTRAEVLRVLCRELRKEEDRARSLANAFFFNRYTELFCP